MLVIALSHDADCRRALELGANACVIDDRVERVAAFHDSPLMRAAIRAAVEREPDMLVRGDIARWLASRSRVV